jgi:hypothetical protein
MVACHADHTAGHVLLPHTAQIDGGGEAGGAVDPLAVGIVGIRLGAADARDALRLRGGRAGATVPPPPPARGAAPWNPDSMCFPG